MRMTSWGTQDELDYLATIGQNSEAVENRHRKEMVRGYLRGADKRRHWGRIDAERVIDYAVSLL